MLNIDTASTAFYSEQSVYDFMCTVLRRCSPRDATKPLSVANRSKFSPKELTDSERTQFSPTIYLIGICHVENDVISIWTCTLSPDVISPFPLLLQLHLARETN